MKEKSKGHANKNVCPLLFFMNVNFNVTVPRF